VDVRLTALFCKKEILLRNQKRKAKTGCNLAESSKKAMAQKGLFFG
jgi:hypothetical protein